jgi:hypothetical protein
LKETNNEKIVQANQFFLFYLTCFKICIVTFRASPVVSLAALRYCSFGMEKLNIPANFLKSLHYVGGAFSSLGSSTNSFKVYEPRLGKYLSINVN